jgi:transketolase
VDTEMPVEPLADKWRAFGWHVVEIDGHDMEQIVETLETAKTVKGQPTIIIAETVKGKGVSFMENVAMWHGKAPCAEEAAQALEEIRSCL